MTVSAPPSALRLTATVALVVCTISFAAILIRWAQAPALAVALWRNVFAVGVLLPAALLWRVPFPRGRELWFSVVSGLFLAAHFAFWISSLDHTSVAVSVVLVCTQPIFVAGFGMVVLHERTSLRGVVGIAAAVAGAMLIALDEQGDQSALFGNLLALLGAVFVAAYVIVGRRVRGGGGTLLGYVVVVYSVAGAALGVACLVMAVPVTGFSAQTWGVMALIAVGPQILGHTLFNWALKYVRASVLSSTILLEPVGSAALAAMLLGEVPGVFTLAGGGVVVAGLALLIWAR